MNWITVLEIAVVTGIITSFALFALMGLICFIEDKSTKKKALSKYAVPKPIDTSNHENPIFTITKITSLKQN